MPPTGRGHSDAMRSSEVMDRVSDPTNELLWLRERPTIEAVTGFAPEGWEAETWVLHAMYENPQLAGLGTHDDLHRRRLGAGEAAPLIINDVNLDNVTTVSGICLGFVVAPDPLGAECPGRTIWQGSQTPRPINLSRPVIAGSRAVVGRSR